MAVEVRRTLVWGTTAAAVLSALLLALNGGGMPRLGAGAAPVRVDTLAAPAPAARNGVAPPSSLPGTR